MLRAQIDNLHGDKSLSKNPGRHPARSCTAFLLPARIRKGAAFEKGLAPKGFTRSAPLLSRQGVILTGESVFPCASVPC